LPAARPKPLALSLCHFGVFEERPGLAQGARDRGTDALTFRQYSSYSVPNIFRSVGSSYSRTNRATPTTSARAAEINAQFEWPKTTPSPEVAVLEQLRAPKRVSCAAPTRSAEAVWGIPPSGLLLCGRAERKKPSFDEFSRMFAGGPCQRFVGHRLVPCPVTLPVYDEGLL